MQEKEAIVSEAISLLVFGIEKKKRVTYQKYKSLLIVQIFFITKCCLVIEGLLCRGLSKGQTIFAGILQFYLGFG